MSGIITSVKNFIFNEEKNQFGYGSYSDMLGLNRRLKFPLSQTKVTTEAEFNTVADAAEKCLEVDLLRFGENFDKIEPTHAKRMMGTIGSMTVIADNDGKLSVRFHKRNEKGLWDGESKKYPEKSITGKYKREVFFLLDEDDDDDED